MTGESEWRKGGRCSRRFWAARRPARTGRLRACPSRSRRRGCPRGRSSWRTGCTRSPGVNVHLVDGTSASLVPQVRHGSLAAAFVAVPPDGLDAGFDHRVLIRDEIVAVVAVGRPQAGRSELSLAELAGLPLITYGPGSGLRPHLRAAFDTAGVPFQPAYATNRVAPQIEREALPALPSAEADG
ncbi:LysR family transcriptional regulator substrate-binding protein [Streptomyces sp. NPDC059629]|uniref:LysR family transcriptional regulator substrate-binding protein n=1 Tax=Streptomyces sp. NPDC059629 TaxID=3346889 RepID=UPI0036CD7BEC